MKICPNCNFQCEDNSVFCVNCGAQFVQTAPNPQQPFVQQSYQPAFDQYDHTSEFDKEDISKNKVFCMLAYLMGAVGIIIALLGSSKSEYTAFHLRQALKFLVVELLAGVCSVLLVWTIIVPIAYAVLSVTLFVLKIICFFQVCGGKAKDAAIIRDLKFLN